MNTLKVLVIDDDVNWTRNFCDNLETMASPSALAGSGYEEYEFRHVTNQFDANDAVVGPSPAMYDLILLDLNYPEQPSGKLRMDPTEPLQGMMWLPELRRLQPRAAIVIISGYPYEKDLMNVVAAVRDYHADDFVPKTAGIKSILGRLSVAIQNSRQRQKLLLFEKESRRLAHSGAARVYIEDLAELLTSLRHPMDRIAQRIESGDPSAIATAPEEIRTELRSANKALHTLVDKMQKHLSLVEKHKQSIDLVGLIGDFLLQYDDWIEEAQAKSIGPAQGLKLEVSTFVGELKLALHEVIANAIEALSSSKRQPADRTLSVSVTGEGDTALVQIEDNGDGFPNEVLANPFTPGKTTRDTQEHVGMGMYVARRAMYAIGGDIIPDNRPEGGARVRLFVPNLK